MAKLQGKSALVTGSDSGIGQAIAITFAREGANVAVHFGNDEQGAQQTAEQARQHGGKVEVFQADLSDPQNALQLFQQATQSLGQIDILVNCAGTGEDASSALEVPLEDFIRVLNIDLVSPFALCQAAAKGMVERGSGAIINVTSVHETIPGSGAGYDAAKGGLRNVTRTLAQQLAPQGVRVNNIAPGMIATPMTAESLEDPQQAEQSTQRIPMGRPGEPQEIANVALFLASDDASYVTGSSYFVDGGLMQSVGS
ncbi:MAG: SDR family oxidoreductase [Chloroflexota bacterium]|nr:SDR family oxidoreductase [Chloroflexota bacterium]